MNQRIGPAEIAWRFQEARNTHDMDAFGRLSHPDATFLNRLAVSWRGADIVVAGHVAVYATVCRGSTLTVDAPDVDPISDDVAILHFRSWLSAGATHPTRPR